MERRTAENRVLGKSAVENGTAEYRAVEYRTAENRTAGNRTEENRKRKQAGVALFLFLMLCLALAGCGKGTSLTSGKSSEKGYSLPEIMVIAMTEKNRYESVCTDEIWKTAVDSDKDFESYLTGQIRDFMEELKVMNLLAQERGMSLTAQERASMSAAAEEYFGNLTKEDIRYMDVTEENVRTVFEDYCMAEKLVEELTDGINLEVSDNEAKVIRFEQAASSDRQAAEELAAAASQENADFRKCAEAAGLTVTERRLGRKDETKEFEEAAFALAVGQISGVIESDGTYYVLKCTNDYDEEATAARKQVIFEERKRKAFQEIYDNFRGTITLTYTGDPWEKLDLASGSHAAGADFFKIYQKHMQ